MKKEKEEDCNDISKTFGGVWNMHLKYVFYYLKICVEIRVNKKLCRNKCTIIKKLKIIV